MIEVRIPATLENVRRTCEALQWFAAPPQTAFLEGECERQYMVLRYNQFGDTVLMYTFWQRLKLDNFSVGHARPKPKAD